MLSSRGSGKYNENTAGTAVIRRMYSCTCGEAADCLQTILLLLFHILHQTSSCGMIRYLQVSTVVCDWPRAGSPGYQSMFRKSSRTNVYVESGIKSQFEICPNRIRELVENPSTRVQKSQLTLKIGCVPPAQAAGNPLFARRMRALRRPIRKSGAARLLGRAPGRRSCPVWAPCPALPNF